jgi:hypothetical protein
VAGAIGTVVLVLGARLSAASASQTPSSSGPAATQPVLAGAWTLNKDLSDQPQNRQHSQEGGDQGTQPRGHGMGRGYGGGYGGGYGRHGGSGGGGYGSSMSPEDQERMREAMKDEMTAPERLTVTESASTVVITTGEGHVTRLSTDGSKIKDENTKIERKTKWDAGKLVSEIKGLGSGKITETYAVDPEHHQLHVTIVVENSRMPKPMTLNRVYDSDSSAR